MNCPKCKKPVDKKDDVCKNCGLVLRHTEKKKKSMGFFKRKEKESDGLELVSEPSPRSFGAVSSKNEGKLKLVFFAVALVLIVILAIILFTQIFAEKGNKTAASVSEFIGKSIGKAENEIDIHFKDSSSFQVLNNASVFDYIYESEDSIDLDGVQFPKWSVCVMKDSSDKIETVTYTDYRVLKKDSRGSKLKKRVNLDKFDKGEKFSSVSDEIDADPYRIIYSKKYVSYVYRYYYENSNSDLQTVTLTVTCDTDGKYLYYTAVDEYPDFV